MRTVFRARIVGRLENTNEEQTSIKGGQFENMRDHYFHQKYSAPWG